MGLRNSLRFRVTLAFLAVGALISVMSVLGTYLWIHDIEMRFIDSTMSEHLNYMVEQAKRDPSTPPPSTPSSRGYIVDAGTNDALPPYLRNLEAGIYERDYDGHEYHIKVQDVGGKRYFLTYDATRIEPLESFLHVGLILCAFAFTVISLWLGYWLSGRIVAPVTRLAAAVKNAEVNSATSLAFTNHNNDELGELALTFEHYLYRVRAFTQREAAFTAEISHELRNYLFVMRSSIELLMSEKDTKEPDEVHLERLRRATYEMGELLDVILILAREPRSTDSDLSEQSNVEEVLREVVGARMGELERKKIRPRVVVEGNAELRAPPPVLRAVLCNLLDRAIAAVNDGEITIFLDENGVTVIEDGLPTPAPDREATAAKGGDDRFPGDSQHGISRSIVERLCERYDWRILMDPSDEHMPRARLKFGH